MIYYKGKPVALVKNVMLPLNVVQETGDSESAVMSQKAVTEALESQQSAIDGLLNPTEIFGQQLEFEDEKYINAVSASISSNDTFSLTYPVSVIPYSKVTVTSFCVADLAVGLFSGENIITAVKLTDSTEFGLYTKEIDIPSNCDNIRVSVRKSEKDKVAISRNSMLDDIVKKNSVNIVQDATQAASQAARNDLLNPIEYTGQELEFEDDKYIQASGAITGHTFFALSYPIAVVPSSKVTVTSYCSANVCVGLFSGDTIVGVASLTNETTNAIYTKEIDIPSNCDNIRVSVAKSQKADVVVSMDSVIEGLINNLTGGIVHEASQAASQAARNDLLNPTEIFGQQLEFEDGKYITALATISGNTNGTITQPISVIPSSKVTVTVYTHPNWCVGLYKGEAIMGVVRMAEEGDFSLYTKEIQIPDNCDNIRLSTRVEEKDKVLVSMDSVIEGIVKKYTAGCIVQQVKRGLNDAESWLNGFVTNSGTFAGQNNRLTSNGYQKNIVSVACEEGYKCRIICYDENKTLLGWWNGTGLQSWNAQSDIDSVNFENIYSTTSAKYFKIGLCKTDDTSITPSDCSAVTVMFRTSEIEENLRDELENLSVSSTAGSFSTEVLADKTFEKDIPFKACFRGSYKFPKDIHSVNGEYELFNFKCGGHNIAVKFEKAVTTSPTTVPCNPVPVYHTGFKVYVGGTLYGSLIPDGWMKELLLGEDAMSIRFTGDYNVASNQDIRLKVDATTIHIYHGTDESVIASFKKANYPTMRALYEALKAETESSLSQFEVYPLTLDGVVPDDIIECDIPLVGQYYTWDTEKQTQLTVTRYDAFPYYFTTKQEGKVYDVEVLFNKNASYPIQILVNGCCVAKFYKTSAIMSDAFSGTWSFTVKDQTSAGIITECVEFDDKSDLSKYPDIKVLYVEKIDEGLDNVYYNYSVSLNKVIGWAAHMNRIGRKYICMKDIEKVFDGSMKVSSNYLWTFQLDDGSIECVTNPKVRGALLRSGIRPAISMMLNKDVTEEDLKIIRASENAGFEYHIHTGYYDAALPIAYYTYEQLNRNVEDALNRFIDIHGSVPTVWGKHSGLYHYGVSRYLKNKGIRINFAGNSTQASLNEITRFSCERNLIQEQSKYTDVYNLDNTY